ncbi:MAG: DUF1501 domain-containing protein [Fimbriimonadaceae bacterium]|nr:DUF1501 domain-containing protein [Fimbriimonadaceae bacterium]
MPIDETGIHTDYCDGHARRDVLKAGVLGMFGLSLSGFLQAQAAQAQTAAAGEAAAATAPRGKADACILLFLAGGPSHLDSWDPKPSAPEEVRGSFKTVATKLPGVQFGEHMTRCAQIAGDLTVIRSMTSKEADHERGTHYLMTGYPPLPGFGVPAVGSVVSKLLPSRSVLPPYIAVPSPVQYGGAGFLGAALDPFSPGGDPSNPGFRVRDLAPEGGLSIERVDRRQSLRQAVDASFARHEKSSDAARAVDEFYKSAYGLISSSEARAAFDVAKEPDAMKDLYGRNSLGQSCLLARRLVQAGVRFVTVQNGGWDTHNNGFQALAGKLPPLDQAVAALVTDLKQQGMLERTMVLVMGEFGRTPRVNPQGGRDHYPQCFSVVAAGGGWQRGAVVGSSDATGANVAERGVKPEDLTATVYTLLGIDPDSDLHSPEGIRIVLSRGGVAVREALA